MSPDETKGRLSPEQLEEIAASRAETQSTLRPTVADLEGVLFTALPVLDHGFVRVVDYMGDDAAVVQAARVSYGRGTKRVSDDRGLIRYLMRHWHSTPFEMCEIKLHVKLPIFVARQWIRHRTANVNEYSARYSILDREFYVPRPEDLAVQSATNRQGRGDVLDPEQATEVMALLREDAQRSFDLYDRLMADPEQEAGYGLARELARMALPLNAYTQWYWKIDLHNLMHFVRLRADAHAQYEIRAYAEVLNEILGKWTPLTHEAFIDYRLNAQELSGPAAEWLKARLAGKDADPTSFGLSPREVRELKERFPD